MTEESQKRFGEGKLSINLRIGESFIVDGIEVILTKTKGSSARLLIVDPKIRYVKRVMRMTEDEAMGRVPVSVEADRRQCT